MVVLQQDVNNGILLKRSLEAAITHHFVIRVSSLNEINLVMLRDSTCLIFH